MDDYYEIVGVDRGASREVIDRKLREQLRIWQRRTSTADLARRQDAERRVHQLSEARSTLLDDTKRREYDRKLAALRSSQAPPAPPTSLDAQMPAAPPWGPMPETAPAGRNTTVPAPSGTSNWLDQARNYLRDNDFHSAAYAARETLRSTPNPPAAAWAVLAQANLGLGRAEDALFEARRAVATDAGIAEAHLTLARVYEQRQQWAEARQAYDAAERVTSSSSPEAEAAHLGAVRTLARSGRVASASDRLERRYATALDRATGARVLARGLVEASRAALENTGTNRAAASVELGQVRRMLTRVREVSADAELLRPVVELEQQLARRTQFGPPTAGYQKRSPADPTGGSFRSPGQPSPYRSNTTALIALVLSILGLVTCGTTSLVGAILGHVARHQIVTRGEHGDSMALAAVVVGWMVTVGAVCTGIVLFNSSGF